MLEIRDLHAGVADNPEILKGVDLKVNPGEVHAIMGPNGSGKSTLAYVLAGHPNYIVKSGQATFNGKDMLAMPPEERAREGFFLSFQHPIEIPGVRMDHFLRAGLNAVRKSRGEDELDVMTFDRFITKKAKEVDMDRAMARRPVNEGFSGGERKRNEVLQMAVLEPKLALLDEPDSGLDVDALRSVSNSINHLRTPERAFILITHYQRILDYVTPDVVHVVIDGRVVRTGGKDLAREVEAEGYDKFSAAAGVSQSGSQG